MKLERSLNCFDMLRCGSCFPACLLRAPIDSSVFIYEISIFSNHQFQMGHLNYTTYGAGCLFNIDSLKQLSFF